MGSQRQDEKFTHPRAAAFMPASSPVIFTGSNAPTAPPAGHPATDLGSTVTSKDANTLGSTNVNSKYSNPAFVPPPPPIHTRRSNDNIKYTPKANDNEFNVPPPPPPSPTKSASSTGATFGHPFGFQFTAPAQTNPASAFTSTSPCPPKTISPFISASVFSTNQVPSAGSDRFMESMTAANAVSRSNNIPSFVAGKLENAVCEPKATSAPTTGTNFISPLNKGPVKKARFDFNRKLKVAGKRLSQAESEFAELLVDSIRFSYGRIEYMDHHLTSILTNETYGSRHIERFNDFDQALKLLSDTNQSTNEFLIKSHKYLADILDAIKYYNIATEDRLKLLQLLVPENLRSQKCAEALCSGTGILKEMGELLTAMNALDRSSECASQVNKYIYDSQRSQQASTSSEAGRSHELVEINTARVVFPSFKACDEQPPLNILDPTALLDVSSKFRQSYDDICMKFQRIKR